MSAETTGYVTNGPETLKITEKGDVEVPETRMGNAAQVQDFGRRLNENDEKRSRKRGLVNGLVGGFPPYRADRMRNAGKAQNCNANFGTARSYMENGSGAFYDLLTEAPGMVSIKTSYGEDEERDEWSRIMSEEADRILAENPLFDYEMQRSQWEMVLHGCGPLFWEDAFKVFPRAAACGDFKVPERTRSDIEYHEIAWADVDYYPPELFKLIQDHQTAAQAGWDVDFAQRCIANAMDIRQPDSQKAYDFEFYQQELKNNSLSYYDDSLVIKLGYCWFKEFDGRITQVIVEREQSTGSGTKDLEEKKDGSNVRFLFQHVGRYENFHQAYAAMYYDRGNGGYHHSVDGMGTKMYSAMEFENRLLCRLMDGAFAPKVLFKPTTTEVTNKMQLAVFGDHGVMPAGWEAVQSPISGQITEGLTMYRASSDLMRSNLSSYRQPVEPNRQGNPETKFGRQLDAAQQGSISKTSFSRYYKQLDAVYAEMVRRMCNLNSEDKDSKKFRERCEHRGVAKECFGRIEAVEAVRVVGEGSAFLRKSSLSELMQTGLISGFSEEGKTNFTNDVIAATCGQKSVTRYNPLKKRSKLPSDQEAMAMLQVAAMKIGTPPTITSSQKALTFAGVFLSACAQALQSLKQGANPVEVLHFLDLCGPAVLAHLKRIANDPLRKPTVEQMMDQMQRMMELTDELRKMIQKKQQQQKLQQQKTQQAMSDEALAARKLQGEEMRKNIKLKAQLQRDAVKTRSQLVIADATAASNIHRQNRLAAFKE
jgi:hypothetical protein